jgi:hypothetical protein
VPQRRIPRSLPDDWFSRLPDDALIRERLVLPGPDNPAPLVDVGRETLRRWGIEGKAPRAIAVGSTRHYKVGELRRWLRGEWPRHDFAAKAEAA